MTRTVSTPTGEQPNVLLLMSDEHSYRFFSHLDPAGEGEPARTPTLDDLAARGCVMHNAYCQVPLCTPSRICLLAGRDPMGSGGWANGARMREGVTTLPEAFAQAGYATCLVGKMHLGGDKQFVGFQHRPYGDLTGQTGHQWEPVARKGGRAMRERTLDAGITEIPEAILQEQCVNRETIAFCREHRHARPDQPWFVCASYSRPHFPLTAPRRHFERYWPDGVTRPKIGRTGDTADHPMTRGMIEGFQTERIDENEMLKARAAYFACVDYLDELLGDLLQQLERTGELDNTIIVYLSDHGELAGEHGVWWKNSWHEAAARVPWIIQTPEHRRGDRPAARLQTPASLADLFPTLGGLCGVSVPEDLPGADLSPSIREGVEPNRGPIFCDIPTPRWGAGTQHRLVREGGYKYVHFADAPDLLFDLEADPHEQHNLVDAPDHAATAKRLRDLVEASWDFQTAATRCAEDRANMQANPLPVEPSGANEYHLPDGRIVFADAPLYEPKVITEDPAKVFADYPAPRE